MWEPSERAPSMQTDRRGSQACGELWRRSITPVVYTIRIPPCFHSVENPAARCQLASASKLEMCAMPKAGRAAPEAGRGRFEPQPVVRRRRPAGGFRKKAPLPALQALVRELRKGTPEGPSPGFGHSGGRGSGGAAGNRPGTWPWRGTRRWRRTSAGRPRRACDHGAAMAPPLFLLGGGDYKVIF